MMMNTIIADRIPNPETKCWPPYEDPVVLQVLKNMSSGQRLIYQGEGYGGCTADDEYHDYLLDHFEITEIDATNEHIMNKNHTRWPLVKDRWHFYTKI